MRAGALGESEGGDAIENAFRSWASDGKVALDVGLRTAVEECDRRGIELIVWPKLNSIVSDIPGLLSVARSHARAGIFLEPAALYPADSGFRIEDFAKRLAEVAAMALVRAIYLESKGGPEETPISPWQPLVEIARQLGKPIVLGGEDTPRFADILGLR